MQTLDAAMGAARLDHLIAVYRDGLLEDTLPFWLRHGADAEHGGIMTCLDRDGSILDTDKGVWQQGRFAWTLGRAWHQIERRQAWLDAAAHTLRFVESHCFDNDGRMFFHVTRDGLPIRKRRYAFSEAFAAAAFGEHARATGRSHSREMAERLCRAFDTHVPDPPKFCGTRPMKSLAAPMIRIFVYQSLRESIGLSDADARIDEAIGEILRDFVRRDLRVCLENVGLGGELLDHLDGRLLNPGHAIEASWFLMEEGRIRDRPEYVRAGCEMLLWMWERGWDPVHGGLLYFVDLLGKPVAEYWHDMKFWWPHNEAIIATLLAYQLTGDPRFAHLHERVHDYAYSLFPDPDFGDWFGYFHRDGRLSSPMKGNLYKGCFHVPRQQMMCWRIAEAIRAGDVGRFTAAP